jgi:dethiobiotin synthetase
MMTKQTGRARAGGVFVTATGTDIGKTFASAGLIRHWLTNGQRVEALKPVLSGFDPAAMALSDSGVLLAALGKAVTPQEIERISPWRFTAPLSPDMAAQREGRRIDVDALVRFCKSSIAAYDGITLIEGVGGVMVPLDGERTVLDWMKLVQIPVVLVAGSYLGTISHTLTALDALLRRDIPIAALAVSESEPHPVPLDETVAAIARFTGSIEVIGVPRLAARQHAHPAFGKIAGWIEAAHVEH